MAKKPAGRNAGRRKTPRARSHRHLWYGSDDIALLVQTPYIRRWFKDVFTGGFEYHFEYGRDVLRFTSNRPLTPKSARAGLTRLGLKKRFVDSVVCTLAPRENAGYIIPRTEQAQYDLWFGSLDHLPGEEIRKIVAATSETSRKWDRRLKVCGRTWCDATLSDTAIVRLTCILFEEVLKRTITKDALDKQLERWKKVSLLTSVFFVPPFVVDEDP